MTVAFTNYAAPAHQAPTAKRTAQFNFQGGSSPLQASKPNGDTCKLTFASKKKKHSTRWEPDDVSAEGCGLLAGIGIGLLALMQIFLPSPKPKRRHRR